MSESHPAIGIDLGTTFSAVARLDETGRPTTLANVEGDKTTPSVLFFDGDEVIAQIALDEAVLGGGTQTDIDNAEDQMVDAQTDITARDYEAASDDYFDAWKLSYDAGGTAQGSLPGTGTGSGPGPGGGSSGQLTLTNVTLSNNNYGLMSTNEQTWSFQNCN